MDRYDDPVLSGFGFRAVLAILHDPKSPAPEGSGYRGIPRSCRIWHQQ